jgi:hypothetical protein
VAEYETWEQIAGYFDGDGTIATSDLSNLPYKLSLSLWFIDQSKDQISMVRNFLRKEGIRTSNVLKHYKLSANLVAVSEYRSVVQMLRKMIPFLYKKAIEAKAALDYYEGKITGNQLMTVLQQEVEAGRRERRPRKVVVDIPYTRPQGLALMKANRSARFRDSFGRFRSKVTPEDFEQIRYKHFVEGKRLADLAREYREYARETIRRVLGGGRGYVGVKGIGRVDTTDTTLRDPRKAPN